LLGFVLLPTVPDFLKPFRDAQDREHELKILEMQMEQQKLGASQRLEGINTNAWTSPESQALDKPYSTGIRLGRCAKRHGAAGSSRMRSLFLMRRRSCFLTGRCGA